MVKQNNNRTNRIIKLAGFTVTTGAGQNLQVTSVCDLKALIETLKSDGQGIKIKSAVATVWTSELDTYRSLTPFLVLTQAGATFTSTLSACIELVTALDAALDKPYSCKLGRTVLEPKTEALMISRMNITKELQSYQNEVESKQSNPPIMIFGAAVTQVASTGPKNFQGNIVIDYEITAKQPISWR